MSTDDLSSITGLQDEHLRALAEHQITDLQSFAGATWRDIQNAMQNIQPRPPGRDRILGWQRQARSKLEEARTKPEEASSKPREAEKDTPEWLQVASFAVIFRQRLVGDTWEYHIGVMRTEVEPEQDEKVWDDNWDFEPIGRWMVDQAEAASASMQAKTATTQPEAQRDAAEPVAAKTPRRTQLRIDSAAITDANRTVDVVTDGELATDLPSELIAPVRVVLTVRGARPGTVLSAVTRILRPSAPGWNPQDPVVLPHSRQAEFDLSGVPAGEYKMSLIAWAPDASAKPVSVRLPTLTIRSGSG